MGEKQMSLHNVMCDIKKHVYILFKKVEQRRKKKGFNVTCSVPIGYTINTLGLKKI